MHPDAGAPCAIFTRYRLNRAGDRQLTRAPHTIVLARLRHRQERRADAARRLSEDKSPREIRRCLKRRPARWRHKLLEATARSVADAAVPAVPVLATSPTTPPCALAAPRRPPTTFRLKGHRSVLDEAQLKIEGRKYWLRRAVDRDGLVLVIPVQARRNQAAAEALSRRLVGGEGTGRASSSRRDWPATRRRCDACSRGWTTGGTGT